MRWDGNERKDEVIAEKLLKHLLERRQELTEETFAHPPAAYEQFQNQLGRHQELTLAIQKLENLLRGDEEGDR
jgi:hypothetical protein